MLVLIVGSCFLLGKALDKKDESTKKEETKKEETKKEETIDIQNNEDNVVECMEIETPYCKLYYPKSWEDMIKIKNTEEFGYKVEFYGVLPEKEEQHLFDICFNSDDGELLGFFDGDEVVNVSFDIVNLELEGDFSSEEADLLYSMQEDVNVLIEKLEEEEGYTNP